MINLKEKEGLDNQVRCALMWEKLYPEELKQVILDQQKFIKSLVEENERLRGAILDGIIGKED